MLDSRYRLLEYSDAGVTAATPNEPEIEAAYPGNAPDDAPLIASGTSGLDLVELARKMKHPERFLGKRPSPYEFFPFGGGNRACLGAAFATFEMKIVLARMLARLELRAVPGYRARIVRRGVAFAPSEGMPVVVERRAA